ncbi:LuxR C-terminal-related transcriptional regulator [Arthrobacter sp. I2-34]|uniref:LuxR C-terminal-related transcriptional regulator n=1 Tax=Arthrobacter hankyongi TaxID=2904801 RepID=A0ABS9L8S5_9MICC|nr:LuxR C-terminal-related transcriptional regulator [Arthrobacter hankyongi]MCG2622978.1 LuxR C-terminal-related transcriptional regulator [Arthrobacter hankyongi]
MQLIDGDLHGRDEEIRHVMKLIGQRARLVTLTGLGGVGKTVLARQVLREVLGTHEIGRFWFDFEDGLPWDDAVLHLRGKVRGIMDDFSPDDPAGLQLIIVDSSPDHEHVPDLVRSLLEEHPKLQILATGRGRLRISLERPVEVKPLSLPAEALPADVTQLVPFIREHSALEFFVDRVLAVVPGLTLDRNTVAGLLAVCRRLGGLPLALGMAALKSNILTPDALLAELDQSLAFLEDFEPSAPARHRSMRACLAPSLDHLSAAEQEVLSVVAEFEGGASLRTLQSLELGHDSSGNRVQLLSVVSILVEKQVLQAVPAQPEGTRIVVMPLVRDYLVLGREAAIGPEQRQRLAHVLLDQSQAMAAVRGPACDRAREWFDDEYANLTQIFGWLLETGDMAAAAELVHSLYLYWLHRGLFEEGLSTAERVLAAGGLDACGQARLLGTMGGLRAHISSFTRAHDELSQTVALWQQVGSPAELAASLVAFSTAALEVNGYPAAEAALKEALTIFEQLDDGWAHARALALLGAAAAGEPGKVEFARTCLEDASAALLTFGDQVAASLPLEQLGRLLLDDGDYDQARLVLEHGLKESTGVGDQVQTSAFLNLLAHADTLTGRPAGAAARYLESLEIAVRLGLKARAVWCLEGLAESLANLTEPDLASAAAASAAVIREELGLEYWVEFCCPRRPNSPQPTPRSTRLAAVGGSAWPPRLVLGQVPALLSKFTGDESSVATAREQTCDGLTRRESEVLRLVAGGFTNQDIAERLVISIDTVKRHISNIYRKIGARGRADATAYAWQNNLVS